MNTMREKKIRRALAVALFHPLNQSARKTALMSSESSANPYRLALLDLLREGNDRFVLLVSLLIESTLRPDINSCHCFLTGIFEKTYDDEGNCHENVRSLQEGVEAVAAVFAPILLLKIWDGNQGTPVLSEPLTDPLESNDQSQEVPSTNNLMSDLDAEATAGYSSSPPPPSGNSKPSKANTKDYKKEMNEYAYGCEVSTPIASRGRGGSDDFTSQVIDDAATVAELIDLDRLILSDTGIAQSKGLIESLLGVLLSAHKHSLTTLQVS
jgi:hypothetical protein